MSKTRKRKQSIGKRMRIQESNRIMDQLEDDLRISPQTLKRKKRV